MRALLVKEDRLAASPLSRLFLVFCAMTMLPGYPILTGAVFVCLGLFYSVQGVKENRDVLYTLLLPVTRAEAVRAKFSFCIRIEAVGFGIMAALTVLRLTLLRNFGPYVNNALMPANPVFLGFVLLIFAVFHRIFLCGFFKTAAAAGGPFLRFFIAALLLVGAGEALHRLPFLRILAETGLRPLLVQSGVLLVCMLLYFLLTRAAISRSIKRFEALEF